VLLCVSDANTSTANIDQNETITSLAQHLDLRGARRVVSDMELALKRLERNVNPRLLAEVLLLDLPEV
jgi:hypothetical protein